jgi:hypothetical protein
VLTRALALLVASRAQHRVLVRYLLSAAWLPDADAAAAAGGVYGTKRFRREVSRAAAAGAAATEGRLLPAGDALPALARVHAAGPEPHVAFGLVAPPGCCCAGAWTEVCFGVRDYAQSSITPPFARLTGPAGAVAHAALHPNIASAEGAIDLDVLTPGQGYTPALQLRTLALSVGVLLGVPTPGCSDAKPGFDGAATALLVASPARFAAAAAARAAAHGIYPLHVALALPPPAFGGAAGSARWPSLLEVGCKGLSLLLGPGPPCALPPRPPGAPVGGELVGELAREAGRRAALLRTLRLARRAAMLAMRSRAADADASAPQPQPEPLPESALEIALAAQLAARAVCGPPAPPPSTPGVGGGALYRRWPDGLAAAAAGHADATAPLHAQEREWAASAGLILINPNPTSDASSSQYDLTGGEDAIPLGVLPMRRLAVRELARYSALAGESSFAAVDLELALMLDSSARVSLTRGGVFGAPGLAVGALDAALREGASSLCTYLGLLPQLVEPVVVPPELLE